MAAASDRLDRLAGYETRHFDLSPEDYARTRLSPRGGFRLFGFRKKLGPPDLLLPDSILAHIFTLTSTMCLEPVFHPSLEPPGFSPIEIYHLLRVCKRWARVLREHCRPIKLNFLPPVRLPRSRDHIHRLLNRLGPRPVDCITLASAKPNRLTRAIAEHYPEGPLPTVHLAPQWYRELDLFDRGFPYLRVEILPDQIPRLHASRAIRHLRELHFRRALPFERLEEIGRACVSLRKLCLHGGIDGLPLPAMLQPTEFPRLEHFTSHRPVDLTALHAPCLVSVGFPPEAPPVDLNKLADLRCSLRCVEMESPPLQLEAVFRFKSLEVLRLPWMGRPLTHEFGRSLAENCRELRSLSVAFDAAVLGNPRPAYYFDKLLQLTMRGSCTELAAHAPHLRELDCDMERPFNLGPVPVTSNHQIRPLHLPELRILSCRSLDPRRFESLSHMCPLTILDLGPFERDSDCYACMRSLVTHCARTLRHLSMDVPSDFGDTLLRSIVHPLPRLQYLELKGECCLTDHGVAYLTRLCPIIQTIRLEVPNVTSKGLCTIFVIGGKGLRSLALRTKRPLPIGEFLQIMQRHCPFLERFSGHFVPAVQHTEGSVLVPL
eukprot:gnl/Trimastix_PCT/2047.p1 GENE.gnl/Trimastix_PCT/2047~~gnl/Trimastix_PCT/2047.p1  ORF type:complete len:603 (+),score=94.33 gnl/Trimastix_PCT/2047:135-1943(+)